MKGVVLLCFVLIAVVSGQLFTAHLFDGLIQELEKIETRLHKTAVITQATCVQDCHDNMPVKHLCKHLCHEAGKMFDNISET